MMTDPAQPRLSLLGTPGCHLCEEAERALVQALAHSPEVGWRAVDIAGSDRLLARYGEKIPVLRDERNGCELCWPFGAPDIRTLLAATTDSLATGPGP